MRTTRTASMMVAGLIACMILAGLHPGEGNGVFGRRVAGSYVVDVDLVGAPLPVQALATLTADGALVATDTDDFGNGVGFGFHSPKHGVWTRTGKRQVTAPVLEYAFDPAGTLVTIFKLVFVVDFDSDMESGDGVVTFDAFMPFQDPLDPSEEPVASGSGTLAFQRITAD